MALIKLISAKLIFPTDTFQYENRCYVWAYRWRLKGQIYADIRGFRSLLGQAESWYYTLASRLHITRANAFIVVHQTWDENRHETLHRWMSSDLPSRQNGWPQRLRRAKPYIAFKRLYLWRHFSPKEHRRLARARQDERVYIVEIDTFASSHCTTILSGDKYALRLPVMVHSMHDDSSYEAAGTRTSCRHRGRLGCTECVRRERQDIKPGVFTLAIHQLCDSKT